jgi:hypothetical protein
MTDHERLARLHTLKARVADEITVLEARLRNGTRTRYTTQPPCGSEKAYQWHRRHDQAKDDACLAAHAAYERGKTAARRLERMGNAA